MNKCIQLLTSTSCKLVVIKNGCSVFVVTTLTILWGYYLTLQLYCILLLMFHDNGHCSGICKGHGLQKLLILGYLVDVVVQALLALSFSAYIL